MRRTAIWWTLAGSVIVALALGVSLILMDRGTLPPVGPSRGLENITSDFPLIGGALTGRGLAEEQSLALSRALEHGDLAGGYRLLSSDTRAVLTEAEFARQLGAEATEKGQIIEIRNLEPVHVQGDVAWVRQSVQMRREGELVTSQHRAVFVWEEGTWRFLFTEPV